MAEDTQRLPAHAYRPFFPPAGAASKAQPDRRTSMLRSHEKPSVFLGLTVLLMCQLTLTRAEAQTPAPRVRRACHGTQCVL